MGFFSDLFGGTHETKGSFAKDDKRNDSDHISIRSTTVFIDKSSDNKTGRHETVYSNTTIDTRTGEAKYSEGYHGNKDNK